MPKPSELINTFWLTWNPFDAAGKPLSTDEYVGNVGIVAAVILVVKSKTDPPLEFDN